MKGQQKMAFDTSNQKIVDFDTIEQFWKYQQHIIRPSRLSKGVQLLIFKKGIFPAWESDDNVGGGRFTVLIKKDFANKIWEDIILSFIGGECPETENLCGIRMNIKDQCVNFQIWTKKIGHGMQIQIGKWFRDAIGFTKNVQMNYKYHSN